MDWTQSKIYQRFGVQRDHITSLHPSPTRHNRKEKVSCHREITFDMSQAGMGGGNHTVSPLTCLLVSSVTAHTTRRLLGPGWRCHATSRNALWRAIIQRARALVSALWPKTKEEEKVPTTLRWPALPKRRWKREGFKVYNLGQRASLFLNLRTCHLRLL